MYLIPFCESTFLANIFLNFLLISISFIAALLLESLCISSFKRQSNIVISYKIGDLTVFQESVPYYDIKPRNNPLYLLICLQQVLIYFTQSKACLQRL